MDLEFVAIFYLFIWGLHAVKKLLLYLHLQHTEYDQCFNKENDEELLFTSTFPIYYNQLLYLSSGVRCPRSAEASLLNPKDEDAVKRKTQ